MTEYERLKRKLRILRQWGEPVPSDLLQSLRRERRNHKLTKQEKAGLEELFDTWRSVALSAHRNRHVPFLKELFRLASKWNVSNRAKTVRRIIQRLHKLPPSNDMEVTLLRIRPWGCIDRRIRHRWHCILRLCRTFDVEADALPKIVQNLGGINAAARRWHELRRLDPS